jgi:hypothetical protein
MLTHTPRGSRRIAAGRQSGIGAPLDNAGRDPHRWQHLTDWIGEVQPEDAQTRNHVLACVHCVREARQVAAFTNRDRQSVRPPVAQNLDGDHNHLLRVGINQPAVDAVVHRLAVERQHHIAGAQPRTRRRASGDHIAQHDAALAWNCKTSRENRGDGLNANPDIASPHPSRLPDLFVNRPNDVAWRAGAQTFGTACLRQNV